MQIGSRIYEQRTAHKLSQEELAERLGVSRQSVSKWETDAAVPDLEKMIKLADVFDTTLDDLVGRTTRETTPAIKADMSQDIKQPSLHQRIIGYILLAASLIAGTLAVLLAQTDDDAILSVLLSATVLVCSVVCLTAKKNGGYWCAWVAFAPLVMLTPFVVGLATYYWRTAIEIVWYIAMGAVAKKRFTGTEIVATRKKTAWIIGGWIGVAVLAAVSYAAINAPLTHIVLNILVYSAVAWHLTNTIVYVTRKK